MNLIFISAAATYDDVIYLLGRIEGSPKGEYQVLVRYTDGSFSIAFFQNQYPHEQHLPFFGRKQDSSSDMKRLKMKRMLECETRMKRLKQEWDKDIRKVLTIHSAQ